MVLSFLLMICTFISYFCKIIMIECIRNISIIMKIIFSLVVVWTLLLEIKCQRTDCEQYV